MVVSPRVVSLGTATEKVAVGPSGLLVDQRFAADNFASIS
jgi:hypothetical protein